MLNFYLCIYMFNLILVHAMLKIVMIGLTPHCVQIMNSHQSHPWICTSQSQTRKARHTIPACKCETRQAIPACKAQTSCPSMHIKCHCIKRAAKAQNSGIAETAKIVVGVRRAQYKKICRANTTTLQEARQGLWHET